MRIGSLFSGIGGLELGLERAIPGAEVIWQVEIDPFCRRVLAKHWPDADRSVCDVTKANSENLGPVDLVCGGFPCQDLSVAGRKAGISGEQSGLYEEFSRVVEFIAPAVIVVENIHHRWRSWVPFVRLDLWRRGYSSVPIQLSAAEVGAPHIRRRVFVVAARDAPDTDGEQVREQPERRPRGWARTVRRERKAVTLDVGEDRGLARRALPSWGVESPVRAVDDGFSSDVARAIGNAVVPQQAYQVGRIVNSIMEQR